MSKSFTARYLTWVSYTVRTNLTAQLRARRVGDRMGEPVVVESDHHSKEFLDNRLTERSAHPR